MIRTRRWWGKSCKDCSWYAIKWWFSRDFITQTKSDIFWTVFKNRWELALPEQIRIADADLSKLWQDYKWFVQNSTRYLLETYRPWDISDEEIIWFFRDDQPKFFSYLTSISWRPETPFISQMAQTHYPNFSKNRDTMAREIEENPQKFIQIVRELETKKHIQDFRNSLWNS